jgi:hypothetical protein
LLSSTADWAKYRIATTYNQSDGYSLTKGVVEASKEVIVYQGTKANNNGFEKFVYQSPFDEQYRDIISNITSIPAETGSGSVKGIFPFPKNEDRDYWRGLLQKHLVYSKNNTTTPVKEILYNYVLNPNGYIPHEVFGFKGGSFEYAITTSTSFWKGKQVNSEIRYRHARNRIASDWVVLDSKVETIRDQTNLSKATTKRTNYKYDPIYTQQTESVVFLENIPAEKVISKTKYCTNNDYNHGHLCFLTYNSCISSCLRVASRTKGT